MLFIKSFFCEVWVWNEFWLVIVGLILLFVSVQEFQPVFQDHLKIWNCLVVGWGEERFEVWGTTDCESLEEGDEEQEKVITPEQLIWGGSFSNCWPNDGAMGFDHFLSVGAQESLRSESFWILPVFRVMVDIMEIG